VIQDFFGGVSALEVVDFSELTNPHRAVGNGQHLVCSALALAAMLGSVQFHHEKADLIPKQVAATWKIEIPVPADGRCFYHCLFLHFHGAWHKKEWLQTVRNQVGLPIGTKRAELEDTDCTLESWNMFKNCIYNSYLYELYIYNSYLYDVIELYI
jgi:hypothetical protein